MLSSTKVALLILLGELLYDFDNSYDYFDKIKIKSKIDAVHTLLDLPLIKQPTFLQKLTKKKIYKLIKLIRENIKTLCK